MGCAAAANASYTQQQMPSTDVPCAEILPCAGTLLNHPRVDKKNDHANGQPRRSRSRSRSRSQPRSKETISIQVTLLSGEVYAIDLPPSATVLDVKVLISQRLGHRTWNQKLVSESNILADSNASLESLGIADNSVVMLLVDREPIGQSSLETPSGEKKKISGNGSGTTCRQQLNQFELQSWQAACASPMGMNWNDSDWGNIGYWGLDLYWTTRSDGCRYEYWSSAPGDNEVGCLVRVDADKMVAIAEGSDDGLSLFDEFVAAFENNEVFQELVEQGWPRPKAWKREDESEGEEDDENEEEE